MTNKKINKALTFIITTFAFFAFNVAVRAGATFEYLCSQNGNVDVPCDGELSVVSGNSAYRNGLSGNNFYCQQPGDTLLSCKKTEGILWWETVNIDAIKIHVESNDSSKNSDYASTYGSYHGSTAGMPRTAVRGLDDNTGSTIQTARNNSVNIVNSGNSVSNGSIKLDGGGCTSYQICKYKNVSKEHSEDEEGMKVRKTTKADGTVKKTLMGPYISNQVNIMYDAKGMCSDFGDGGLTAFCLEAQFYGPADANGGCLNYKATQIRTDSRYEVALFRLYELSGGNLLGDERKYFTYQAAARILAYVEGMNYQSRDATGISNIAGHAIPYQQAAQGADNGESIGPVGPEALSLVNQVLGSMPTSDSLLNGAYGIRASQITSFTPGSNGYQATYAVTVQNVNSPDEVSFGDIQFSFGDSSLGIQQVGDATYDAGAKTITFTALVTGMGGEVGQCSNATMKVTLTKEGRADIRKAFMLDAVGYSDRNARQRFAVFAPGAPSTVSYEIVLSNCVPDDETDSCPQDAALTCVESDVSGKIVVNEGSQGGGATDWEGCIIHHTDSQGNSYDVVDNSAFEQTEDTGLDSDYIQAFVSYIDQESGGHEVKDSKYCTISCKEKYEFLLPGYKENVKQGTYFSFHTNGVPEQHAVVGIGAERKCVSTDIDNERFNKRVKDLRAQQVDYLNAYLYYYQLWKAMTSKEVMEAYGTKIRYGEITPGIKPEDVDCTGKCDCGSEIDIENRACLALATEEMQAACERLGGIHKYIEEYEFTTADRVNWETGQVIDESDKPFKIDMIYFTLNDPNSTNNQDGDLLEGHSVNIPLTLSYDEFVTEYSQFRRYEISRVNPSAGKAFYKQYYKSEEEDNNYYIFEDSVKSIGEYSKTRTNYFNYSYKTGGHLEEHPIYVNGVDTGDTYNSCDDNNSIPQTRGIKYFYEEDGNINSSSWDPEFTDYNNDENKQLAKYMEAVRKVQKAYVQAKKKYESLIYQISDQAAMIQECTNYLKNMESNVRTYEFNPIITFNYEEKTYMDMLAPSILTNIQSSAPEVTYNTFLCSSASDPEAVFGCNDVSDDPYQFKYLYQPQLTEKNEQFESKDTVHQELEGIEDHQNVDDAGLAVVKYYNVSRVGSQALYGRYSQSGGQYINGKWYDQYNDFSSESCEGCFEFYQSDTQFFTEFPDGIITKNPSGDYKNIVDTDGRVYPIAINTPEGLYGFSVKFSNIGQFNETGTLGRIMGGGDGKPGTMSGEAGDTQVCWYEVERMDAPNYNCPPPNDTPEWEEIITACVEGGTDLIECQKQCPPVYDEFDCPNGTTTNGGYQRCVENTNDQTYCYNTLCLNPTIDDNCPAPYDTEEYKQILITCVATEGKTMEECKRDKCPNGGGEETCDDIKTKYCKLGTVNNPSYFSTTDFERCVIKLIQHPSGCCRIAESYFDSRTGDNYERTNEHRINDTYNVPNEVQDEFDEKCPHNKVCETFKIITVDETPSGLLTDNGTVINDGALQFNARTVSNNNLFPNGNSSSNWNTTAARTAITKIEEQGDGIFGGEPDYHITLTSECVREIKNYNRKQEDDNGGYSNGGYSDYTNIVNTNKDGQSISDLNNKTWGSNVQMGNEFKQILEKYCSYNGSASPEQIIDESRVLS